jgi:phytoene dehydrogenase-like protein
MHVGITGGGISGLYSALLLHRDGHSTTIFEATDRLGGRIYTHHFQARDPKEDPFFEAGAMTIPRTALHKVVFDLVRYLNARNPIDRQANSFRIFWSIATIWPSYRARSENLAIAQRQLTWNYQLSTMGGLQVTSY